MPKKTIYSVQKIDEKWNEKMLSIVRNSPIEANGLKIVFDRHPDIFFIPKFKSTKLQCAGFYIRNQLSGFAMMLHKEVLVKGAPQTVLYFSNMVVNQSARGKGFLYRVSDFFLKDLPENIQLGYAVIMRGNRAAKQLLNRFHPRYPNMPHSKVIGQWQVKNILLICDLHYKSRYTVRHAQMDDIDTIVQWLQKEYKTRLFGPIVTKKSILNNLNTLPNFGIENYYIAESEKGIAGVCCAWDMAPVKKNLVIRYSRKFKWASILINFFALIFNFPKLPAEGETFRDVTITDYAVKNRNPDILKALLLKIYNEYRERRYHMMIFGYTADDPIKVAARPFISQSVISEILIFSKSKHFIDQFEDTSFPLIDMTLL